MPENRWEFEDGKDNFTSALNGWMNDIEKAVTLDTKERAIINKAGAEAYKQALKQETKNKHYDHKHRYSRNGEENFPHLADSVNSSTSRQNAGAVDIGFDDKVGYIARFLNDGTKKMAGDHFVDNTRSKALAGVFEAQKIAYYKIVGNKL